MSRNDVLDAEPPPAYAPTPDFRLGESTVEFGPHRPFQAAPAQLQSLSTQVTGVGDVQYVSPQPTGARARLAPPPRHPTLMPHTPVLLHPTPPRPAPPPEQLARAERPMSDFAADFYTAGAGDFTNETSPRSSTSSFSPPSGPPPGSRYSPPPHPPLPSRPIDTPPQRPSSTTSSAGSVDDGRPTHTPVPGRPLLRNGEILVYPSGYECPKCELFADCIYSSFFDYTHYHFPFSLLFIHGHH
jgi:hypothetical protein